MALHVVVGASSIGVAVANRLAKQGEQARIITRNGGGPENKLIERVAADATNADKLSALVQGAAALYNCASPAYDRWLTDWPPLNEAILTAAERTGATLVFHSNLYGYGILEGPMTENTPYRATHSKLRIKTEMWLEALARHNAGRIRVTETRAGDHLQPNSLISLLLCKQALKGNRVISPVPLDFQHSWTSVNDGAKLMTIVAVDSRAWGKVWHVPTNPPLTARELVTRFAEVNGLATPKFTVLPYSVLWTAGLFVSIVRELRPIYYQLDRPFIMDSSAAMKTFGLNPESINEALKDVARLLKA